MKKMARSIPLWSLSGIALWVGLCSLPTLLHSSPHKAAILDRIVAVVNHEAIPESELNRQMHMLMLRFRQNETPVPPLAQLRKQLLDKIILEKIQLQKAATAHIEVTEPELNKALTEISGRDNSSVEQLQKFLEEQGISFSQFRDNIKNELIISRLQQQEIGPTIHLSSAEIDQFVKSAALHDSSDAEYRLGHILIALPETPSAEAIAKAKQHAEQLLQRLRKGADFSEIAMGESAGAQALNGGDLGWRKSAEIPTLFAKITSKLKVGELNGPIHNDSGFHIIKLLDKRVDGHHYTPKLMRNKATDLLFQRKFEERLVTWLRRMRDEAEVEVYLNGI